MTDRFPKIEQEMAHMSALFNIKPSEDFPYPIALRMFGAENAFDHCANVDTVVSILYGDMSLYTGRRVIEIPAGSDFDWVADRIKYEIAINADCYGIEPDVIQRVLYL